MIEYKYAYLLGSLFLLLPVWVALFLWRKDVRREMLVMSGWAALAGPFAELIYLKDYWNPETIGSYPFGIEAYLFGFLLGGIGGVAYEVAYSRRLVRVKDASFYPHSNWLIGFLMAGFVLISAGLYSFGVNSIYATSIGLIVMGLGIVLFRRDLLYDALISGVLMGLIMLCAYIPFLAVFPEAVERWWFLDNISGVLIAGIPIEEILWAFSWGFLGGPLYEFITRQRVRKVARS